MATKKKTTNRTKPRKNEATPGNTTYAHSIVVEKQYINDQGAHVLHFNGLSEHHETTYPNKTLEGQPIGVGSTFWEVDTDTHFVWDGAQWLPYSIGGGGGEPENYVLRIIENTSDNSYTSVDNSGNTVTWKAPSVYIKDAIENTTTNTYQFIDEEDNVALEIPKSEAVIVETTDTIFLENHVVPKLTDDQVNTLGEGFNEGKVCVVILTEYVSGQPFRRSFSVISAQHVVASDLYDVMLFNALESYAINYSSQTSSNTVITEFISLKGVTTIDITATTGILDDDDFMKIYENENCVIRYTGATTTDKIYLHKARIYGSYLYYTTSMQGLDGKDMSYVMSINTATKAYEIREVTGGDEGAVVLEVEERDDDGYLVFKEEHLSQIEDAFENKKTLIINAPSRNDADINEVQVVKKYNFNEDIAYLYIQDITYNGNDNPRNNVYYLLYMSGTTFEQEAADIYDRYIYEMSGTKTVDGVVVPDIKYLDFSQIKPFLGEMPVYIYCDSYRYSVSGTCYLTSIGGDASFTIIDNDFNKIHYHLATSTSTVTITVEKPSSSSFVIEADTMTYKDIDVPDIDSLDFENLVNAISSNNALGYVKWNNLKLPVIYTENKEWQAFITLMLPENTLITYELIKDDHDVEVNSLKKIQGTDKVYATDTIEIDNIDIPNITADDVRRVFKNVDEDNIISYVCYVDDQYQVMNCGYTEIESTDCVFIQILYNFEGKEYIVEYEAFVDTSEDDLGYIITPLNGEGGGSIEYVDELPATGDADTLYILNGGNIAHAQTGERGTEGSLFNWKFATGITVTYDSTKNAYHFVAPGIELDAPLGLADVSFLASQHFIEETAEDTGYVSYGRSSSEREQGLLLLSTMDKDNLPNNTYLKSTGVFDLSFNANNNSITRTIGTGTDTLYLNSVADGAVSIFNLIQSGALEVCTEAEAQLVVHANDLIVTQKRQNVGVYVIGDVDFDATYVYQDGKWIEISHKCLDTLSSYSSSERTVSANAIVDFVREEIEPVEREAVFVNTQKIIDGVKVPLPTNDEFNVIFDGNRVGKYSIVLNTGHTYSVLENVYGDAGIKHIYVLIDNIGIADITCNSDGDVDTTLTKFGSGGSTELQYGDYVSNKYLDTVNKVIARYGGAVENWTHITTSDTPETWLYDEQKTVSIYVSCFAGLINGMKEGALTVPVDALGNATVQLDESLHPGFTFLPTEANKSSYLEVGTAYTPLNFSIDEDQLTIHNIPQDAGTVFVTWYACRFIRIWGSDMQIMPAELTFIADDTKFLEITDDSPSGQERYFAFSLSLTNGDPFRLECDSRYFTTYNGTFPATLVSEDVNYAEYNYDEAMDDGSYNHEYWTIQIADVTSKDKKTTTKKKATKKKATKKNATKKKTTTKKKATTTKKKGKK